MKLKSILSPSLILLGAAAAGGQNRISIETTSHDISYNLDLEAVATLFSNVYNLEEFERELNNPDNHLSNLDLNDDGYIDYLRVVESYENRMNVIVIQAVLDDNVYQDVASIVVERKRWNKTRVQIIGSPYLYGVNYVIEPVFVVTPRIYRMFRSRYYVVWQSPYYWGHYPAYYHYRRPTPVNVYVKNVYNYINHDHYYGYTNTVHYSDRGRRMFNSISRNDYETRRPEASFQNRNSNAINSRDLRSGSYGSSGLNSDSRSYSASPRSSRNHSEEMNRSSRSSKSESRMGSGSSSSGQYDRSRSGTSSRSSSTRSTRSDSYEQKWERAESPRSSSSGRSSEMNQQAPRNSSVSPRTRSNNERNSGTNFENNSQRSNRSSGGNMERGSSSESSPRSSTSGRSSGESHSSRSNSSSPRSR